MRIILLLISCLLPTTVLAEQYRVSKIKFENFKSYQQYDIDTEQVRSTLIEFSKQTPIVDENGLYDLAGKLAEIYHNKGLVFHRVDVVFGNPMRIRLIPGVMSATHIRGNSLYKSYQLRPYFIGLTSKLVDSKSMNDAVSQMNALPGINAFAYLSVGANPGEAQLNINANDESWGNVTTRLSNYGTTSTGLYRLNSQLTLNNPFELGAQWQFGGNISDETSNWALNTSAQFFKRKHQQIKWAGQYQHISLSQDFSILDMSGNQFSSQLSYQKKWLAKNNRSYQFKTQLGYLYQQLTNELNITSLDISLQDLTFLAIFDFDKASNKQFSKFGLSNQTGQLLEYEAPLTLENNLWSLMGAQMSYARSITKGSIQQGMDFKASLQAQYALTELPSHRKLSLSGVNNVASYQAGLLSADSGYIAKSILSLLTINSGTFQTVFEIEAQAAQGNSGNTLSDQLFGFGASLDLNIGPLKTQTKWFTNENNQASQLWFELSMQWPQGN